MFFKQAALAVAYFNIKIPELLGIFVNALSRFARVGDFEEFDAGEFLSEMKGPAMNLFGMYLLQSCFTFVYILLLSQIGEQMAARIRQDLFKQIIIQDLSFFDANRTGELVNRLTTDVQDFKSSFKQFVAQGLRSVAQLIGTVHSELNVFRINDFRSLFFRWWRFIVSNIAQISDGGIGVGAICCHFHVIIWWSSAIA